MKIELKHLAPYLPYGLKVVTQYGLDVPKGGHIFEICGICERPDMAWKKGEIGLFFTRLGQNREMSNEYFEFRPALKPLSDLTKEIEHNGEKFVPIDWFENKYYTLDLHKQCKRLLEEDGENWIYQSDYMIVGQLFEWHFDVFGLIEQGLAIDLNTLKS